MSKFKVTLRKNGRPVGEMCYPSEAVAVTQATAMTEAAPGTTASVSTGTKSNPRRRNGAAYLTGGFHFSRGGFSSRESAMHYAQGENAASQRSHGVTYKVKIAKDDEGYSVYFGPIFDASKANPRRNGGTDAEQEVARHTAQAQTYAQEAGMNAGGEASQAMYAHGAAAKLWREVTEAERALSMYHRGNAATIRKAIAKAEKASANADLAHAAWVAHRAAIDRIKARRNPRRNGQVFWTPQGPAVEAHSPTQWTSVEIESRDGGKTYSVVAYGYADGREIRSVRAFGSKTVEAAQKWADDVRRELRIRANPRRNGGSGLSKASVHSRALAGSPARMADRLKALGLAFEDFGKAGSPLYPLWNSYRSAQHFAEQTSRGSSASSLAEARVAFQQFVEAERVLLDAVGANPRRNGASGHICRNPGCDCRANPLPTNATHREAIAYHHGRAAVTAGKVRVAHLKAAAWHSTALTQGTTLTALRKAYEWSKRADSLEPRKNPRNGTWSAERMAALAQRAQFERQ